MHGRLPFLLTLGDRYEVAANSLKLSLPSLPDENFSFPSATFGKSNLLCSAQSQWFNSQLVVPALRRTGSAESACGVSLYHERLNFPSVM